MHILLQFSVKLVRQIPSSYTFDPLVHYSPCFSVYFPSSRANPSTLICHHFKLTSHFQTGIAYSQADLIYFHISFFSHSSPSSVKWNFSAEQANAPGMTFWGVWCCLANVLYVFFSFRHSLGPRPPSSPSLLEIQLCSHLC